MCRCDNSAINNMKAIFISLCLFVVSNYLWSQNDPYFKSTNIPADLEEQAQTFLQSTCDDIQFTWDEKNSSGCNNGEFIFILPLKYTYEQKERTDIEDFETYQEVVPEKYMKGGDEWIRNVTVTKQRPITRVEYKTVIKPTNEMLQIKKKLIYQKTYISSLQTIKDNQQFEDENFQNNVRNEINTKYSEKAYRKYIKEKEAELKQLIAEWKRVPLKDSDIKTQTSRIRSSWKNFAQEKAIELQQLSWQCQALLEAKQFTYKYEHDFL